MQSEDLFGELRSLLQSGAGTARGWGRLCELVEGFEPERFSAQVLPYVLAHRDRFPEYLRFVPRRWLKDEALWPLARIADALLVDLESAAWAAQYLAQQHEPHTTLLIIQLPLDEVDGEALKRALGVELPDAPGLAAVRRLYISPGKWSDESALGALLRSRRLESLEEVVARGQLIGDWLPDALANHGKLITVDISARSTGRVDSLPWSVRSLGLQCCRGELLESLPWFGAAAPSLERLWLSPDGAATLADQVDDVYHRLTGLNQLEAPTTALLTMLAHKPLAQAWAKGLKRLESVDRQHTLTAADAERLSQLRALEAFAGARFERWQDVVTIVEGNPGLTHLSLRGTLCAPLIQALEARGLSERISVLSISQVERTQLDALYVMESSRWPMLRSLSLGWDIDGELDISRVALLSQLQTLSIQASHTTPLLEASLSAALLDGKLTALESLKLSSPLSVELGELVCGASWPKLKVLSLDCEVCDALVPLVIENDSLSQLRWLDFEEPENFLELDEVEVQLKALFKSARLPALEYIGLEDRLLERALLESASRSEWLLTNRMMYWFYRRHPEVLGLVGLFGEL